MIIDVFVAVIVDVVAMLVVLVIVLGAVSVAKDIRSSGIIF